MTGQRSRTKYAVRDVNTGELVAIVDTWERRLALALVAKTRFTAARASQDEMYDAGRAGLRVLSGESEAVPASADEAEEADAWLDQPPS